MVEFKTKPQSWEELRTQARIADVPLWSIGVKAGISDSTLRRWMREGERPDRLALLADTLASIIEDGVQHG